MFRGLFFEHVPSNFAFSLRRRPAESTLAIIVGVCFRDTRRARPEYVCSNLLSMFRKVEIEGGWWATCDTVLGWSTLVRERGFASSRDASHKPTKFDRHGPFAHVMPSSAYERCVMPAAPSPPLLEDALITCARPLVGGVCQSLVPLSCLPRSSCGGVGGACPRLAHNSSSCLFRSLAEGNQVALPVRGVVHPCM